MYSELLLIGSAFPLIPGLLLTAGCLKNSPSEKEVIASWILVGDQSVKDSKWFSSYASTAIPYLNHIEPSSIVNEAFEINSRLPCVLGATVTSTVIET